MLIPDFIVDFEKRARDVGVPIVKLCEAAGISNSTYTRWKQCKSKPNMETYNNFLDALKKAEAAALGSKDGENIQVGLPHNSNLPAIFEQQALDPPRRAASG